MGETTQEVKDRIARHKYSVNDKLVKLPLAKHFVSQLKFMVIDGISKNRRGVDREMALKKKRSQPDPSTGYPPSEGVKLRL